MLVIQHAPKVIDTSSELNDLFQLTYTLETAKDTYRNYRLLSKRESSGRYATAPGAGVNGIYLTRTSFDVAFDDNGRQINPLTARLTGNVEGVVALLNECGWQARPGQVSAECVPAPPVYADGQKGSIRKKRLMTELRQVVFSQTGHFHDCTAVDAVLQHGTGNFQPAFGATFRHCCKNLVMVN